MIPSEPASFDLTRFSEAVRRRLYDRIAEIQFDDPDVRCTPDQAHLQIVYFAGRWFALWVDLEEPEALPDLLRVKIMRIGAQPSDPRGVELQEV